MTVGLRGVRIERATGRTVFCGEVREAADWAGADDALSEMSARVDRGMRDECDFVATFEDGFTYVGTIEIRHPLDRDAPPDILSHIRSAHSTLLSDDDETEGYRRLVDPRGERAAAIREMFETYDFGGEPAAPTPA